MVDVTVVVIMAALRLGEAYSQTKIMAKEILLYLISSVTF